MATVPQTEAEEINRWRSDLVRISKSLQAEPGREDLVTARRELLELVTLLEAEMARKLAGARKFTAGDRVSVKLTGKIVSATVLAVTGPVGSERVTIRTKSSTESVPIRFCRHENELTTEPTLSKDEMETTANDQGDDSTGTDTEHQSEWQRLHSELKS